MNDKLFKSLHDSEMGKQLVQCYRELQAKAWDARNWGPNDTKETAQQVSDFLQRELIDKIQLQNTPKQPEKNPYE